MPPRDPIVAISKPPEEQSQSRGEALNFLKQPPRVESQQEALNFLSGKKTIRPKIEPTPELTNEIAGIGKLSELGKAGLENPIARLAIAAADTVNEKKLAFKEFFPEGSLRFIPRAFVEGKSGDPVLFFKKDLDAPFQRLDDPDFNFTAGAEITSDVLEFLAQDLGALFGEGAVAASQFLSKSPDVRVRAVGLISRMTLAAAGGTAFQEGIEFLAFGQEEDIRTVTRRSVSQGAITAFGGLVFDKLGRPVVNMFKGAGFIGLREGGKEAIESAKRLGLRTLPLNILTDSPIVQRLGKQAGALVSTLGRYIQSEEKALAELAMGFGAKIQGVKNFRTLPAMSTLITAAKKENQRLRSNLLRATGRKTTTRKEFGDAFLQDYANFNRTSRARVSAAYGHARGVETPNFNLNPLTDTAREVKLLATEIDLDSSKGLVKIVDKILKLEQKSVPGVRTASEVAEETGLNIRGAVDLLETQPGVPKRIPDLIVTKNDGTQVVFDELDQLRFIRTQLFDFMTPPPGEARTGIQNLASRMFASISKTLKTPTNTSPKFLKTWQRADRLAKERFTILQAPFLVAAARKETPNALAARLTNLTDPALADNFRTLQRVMTRETMGKMKDAMFGNWLREGGRNLDQAFKAADPENLRVVFTPREKAGLKQYSESWTKLEAVGIGKAQERYNVFSNAVDDLLLRKDDARVFELTQLIQRNGGIEGSLGNSVRAGIFENLFKKNPLGDIGSGSALTFERFNAVDFNALTSRINTLEKSTVWDNILTEGDRTFLKDTQRIQDFLRLSEDAGTSLQAASAARGLFQLSAGAARVLLENIGLGRIMVSPRAQAILTGIGGKKIPTGTIFTAIASALSLTATDVDKISPALEKEALMVINLGLIPLKLLDKALQ